MRNRKEANYNYVENLHLYCFDSTDIKKGVSLNCVMNGYDKEKEVYLDGLTVKVICLENNCDGIDELFDAAKIVVSGNMMLSNYYSKKHKHNVAYLTVFATAIDFVYEEEERPKRSGRKKNRR